MEFTYPTGHTVLRDVNFHVERGAFVIVTGPSGAGKSTLLKLLYGALQPTRGHLLIQQHRSDRLNAHQKRMLRQRIGVVLQQSDMLPMATVYDTLAMPLEIQGMAPAEIARRALHMAQQVGLAHHYHAPIHTLSIGEQQRAAIGRALIHDPMLVIADEPTGSVDDAMGEQLMCLFHHAHHRGTTIIMTTHNRRWLQQHRGPVWHVSDGTLTLPRQTLCA